MARLVGQRGGRSMTVSLAGFPAFCFSCSASRNLPFRRDVILMIAPPSTHIEPQAAYSARVSRQHDEWELTDEYRFASYHYFSLSLSLFFLLFFFLQPILTSSVIFRLFHWFYVTLATFTVFFSKLHPGSVRSRDRIPR